jgi:NAD(P)-dependent dehydrogenase (short-subunit alcohol dehydrogenase family)
MSLIEKRVVVTGAASGIGRSMVRMFSAEGASVVAADLDASGLEALQRELPAISTVACNVAEPDDVDRVLDVAGAVDVMCNNAGLMDRLQLVDEVSLADWNRIFAVNVTGPYLFCHRLVPQMVERGGGVIINTASNAGLRGGRAGAAYTASKHALVGLSRNVAATYAHRGIRCNAICPGGTRGGARGAIEEGTVFSERGLEILMGRDKLYPPHGTADEVASVAVFLASDAGRRINGADLVVDGAGLAF